MELKRQKLSHGNDTDGGLEDILWDIFHNCYVRARSKGMTINGLLTSAKTHLPEM
jgi:hypothetical protein